MAEPSGRHRFVRARQDEASLDPYAANDMKQLAETAARDEAAPGRVLPHTSQIDRQLTLLARSLPLNRQIVSAGDRICRAGETFDRLHVVNTGLCKSVRLSADGGERITGIHFRGDWMGLGAIAAGRYDNDVIALDTGEVWSVRYEDLLGASAREPAVVALVCGAMSKELLRAQAAVQSLATLSADARVAAFLSGWADNLQQRGLRADSVRLPMTRADIGNFLGMTLESVSRALNGLARRGLIRFADAGRRHIVIPEPAALAECVGQTHGSPHRGPGKRASPRRQA